MIATLVLSILRPPFWLVLIGLTVGLGDYVAATPLRTDRFETQKPVPAIDLSCLGQFDADQHLTWVPLGTEDFDDLEQMRSSREPVRIWSSLRPSAELKKGSGVSWVNRTRMANTAVDHAIGQIARLQALRWYLAHSESSRAFKDAYGENYLEPMRDAFFGDMVGEKANSFYVVTFGSELVEYRRSDYNGVIPEGWLTGWNETIVLPEILSVSKAAIKSADLAVLLPMENMAGRELFPVYQPAPDQPGPSVVIEFLRVARNPKLDGRPWEIESNWARRNALIKSFFPEFSEDQIYCVGTSLSAWHTALWGKWGAKAQHEFFVRIGEIQVRAEALGVSFREFVAAQANLAQSTIAKLKIQAVEMKSPDIWSEGPITLVHEKFMTQGKEWDLRLRTDPESQSMSVELSQTLAEVEGSFPIWRGRVLGIALKNRGLAFAPALPYDPDGRSFVVSSPYRLGEPPRLTQDQRAVIHFDHWKIDLEFDSGPLRGRLTLIEPLYRFSGKLLISQHLVEGRPPGGRTSEWGRKTEVIVSQRLAAEAYPSNYETRKVSLAPNGDSSIMVQVETAALSMVDVVLFPEDLGETFLPLPPRSTNSSFLISAMNGIDWSELGTRELVLPDGSSAVMREQTTRDLPYQHLGFQPRLFRVVASERSDVVRHRESALSGAFFEARAISSGIPVREVSPSWGVYGRARKAFGAQSFEASSVFRALGILR